MPTDSEQIYEEGIRIPPVKIYEKGKLQKEVLKVILHNCRIPEWNQGDFNSIVAACRTGANRCIEMAQRFGDDLYLSALQELLDRNRRAMRNLIISTVSEEKAVLRGLSLRRWHGDGALQDRVQHVARRRAGGL